LYLLASASACQLQLPDTGQEQVLTVRSYANAAIGPAETILKTYIYPEAFAAPSQNSSLVSSMGFAGMVLGQLCE
jgi:hypothetical protein